MYLWINATTLHSGIRSYAKLRCKIQANRTQHACKSRFKNNDDKVPQTGEEEREFT
jgi:hypothetical protein